MSCIEPIPQSEGQRLAAEIAEWDAAWHSVARYSIIRSEFGKPKRVVAEGRRYGEGKPECSRLDTQACAEVGCRPDAFGRPVHYLQLEQPEETNAAFRLLRGAG